MCRVSFVSSLLGKTEFKPDSGKLQPGSRMRPVKPFVPV